jgi:single-stranded-DNA-specific exonuclease
MEATLEKQLEPQEILWKPRNPHPRPAPAGLPRLIWEVLNARGFEDETVIQKWLSPSLKILRDPFCLTDMEKAIRRLVTARVKQEPIVIYADYDLDGTSACAILLKAFECLGYKDVTYYQPKRLSEGYGIHKAALQKLYEGGRRLLVSVDLGITAVEEVEFGHALGLDMIITDHHLPKETLPAAIAVVNPNRGNCDSGLGHLCGTGVAFYMALALRRTLLEEGVITEAFEPKALLDCFVIGTLTDMVPLVDENRVLVKHGLLALAQTKRPGLRVLMQALGLWGNPLTSQDVAIRFAPKLNALSRMEMGILPIDLYLVEDENKAQLLVEQVLSNNQDRQASQKSAESEALRFLRENPPKSSIFVYSSEFHRGVVGLVATKMCQEYGLPAYVGALNTETGIIVGSARMPDGSGINALEAMAAAGDALEQFGGHAAAAGFELRIENAERFRERLESYFAEKLLRSEPRVWTYDAVATLEELNPQFMAWYESLSPFGAHFAPPVFCVRNVRVSQAKPLKGGHFRLTLSESSQTSRVGLWFSPPKGHVLLDGRLDGGVRVDALVEPQWNYYSGRKTLQLLIQDLKPAT